MVKTYDEWAKDYDKLSDKQKKTYYDSATLMANKGNQDYQSVLKYIEQYNSGASTKTSSTKTSSTKTTTSTATPTTTTNTTTQYVAPTANTGNRDYQNDSEERQMEIVRNLEDAYAKNPNNFSNWDTFASKFNYDYSGRSDIQRQVMKDWYEKKFGATASSDKTVTYSYFDQNNNQHITYSDGSTKIIPGSTVTQQGTQGQQTGRSADGKTYTFKEGYEPIYPEGEITSDRSTSIANEGKFQQKSDAYTYYEDSPTRYNEILNNLEDIYVSHPQFFTDRTTFDANFQLDQRSVGQQALMVEWFYNKKKQEKDLNAVSNLNDGQSIYDAINSGNLTNDQLDLLKGTPQYDQYLSITKDKVNLATINNDPSMFFVNSIPATLEDLRDEIMATIDNMTDYNMWEYMLSLYDGEDYDKVRTRLENSTQEALLVKAEYDSIDADVRGRLEGTGASKAYINAVIAREQNDLIPRVNTAYAQLQADQTNYQLWHQSIADKYQSYCDQANYEVTRYNAQINAFQTMWGVYRDVAQYDWDYKQQYRLMQLQESYNNPMLDSEDEDEQKRALKSALQTYYDTYGPIIKRDINQVMEDVLAYAKKNNVSVAEALQKNFVDQLQSKPEYQELKKQYLYGRDYLYQKAGTASSKSSSSSSSSSSATGETPVGGSVTPSASWWQQTTDSEPTKADYAKVENALNSFISTDKYSEGMSGGECGRYVNQYLNTLGFGLNNIKDSIEDKASLINDYAPEIGSIVVMDSSVAPEYGHVAIVKGVNLANGNLIVQDSNRSSDGIIKEHEIDPNSKSIRGYINPAKAIAYNNFNGVMPNAEYTTADGKIVRVNAMGYLDALVPQYKEYNANGKISDSVAGLNETLNSMGVSGEEFRSQADNFTKYGAEARSYAQDLIDQYRQVSELYNMVFNYNAVYDTFGIGDSDEFRAKFNQLKNKISLGYFTDVRSKGVTFGSTTEGEWKLVGQASSELGNWDGKVDLQLHKDAIAQELLSMRDNLKTIIRGLPVYQYSVANKTSTTSTTANGGNVSGGDASNTQTSGRSSNR